LGAGRLDIFGSQYPDGIYKEEKAQGGANEVDGSKGHLSSQALLEQRYYSTT
jgi:hypothetical protein